MKDIVFRSLSEHKHSLKAREYSSAELTRVFLERIVQCDHTINAYVSVCPEEAMKEAEASDVRRRNNEELSALDDILAKKVMRKLETQNPIYLRNAAEGLIAYLDELFGADKRVLKIGG